MVWLVLFFSLLMPSGVFSAGQEDLIAHRKNPKYEAFDLSQIYAPRWHRASTEPPPRNLMSRRVGTPVPHPAENKLIYIAFDESSGCDQIFLFDVDTLRELRITSSCDDADRDGIKEGDKLDVSWGPYFDSLTYSLDGVDPGRYFGWSVVYARNMGEGLDSNGSSCQAPGCSIFITTLGTSLFSPDVQGYRGSPRNRGDELRLTSPVYGAIGTFDRKPVFNPIYKILDDPINNRDKLHYSIAFIRHNDPNSSGNNMVYQLTLNADGAINPAVSISPGRDRGIYLKNLTARHSGNCPGLPNLDFDAPQWFPDGENAVFTFRDLASKSWQIATVHESENNDPVNPNPFPESYACGNPSWALVSPRTSFTVHTFDGVNHENPLPSKTVLYQGRGERDFGVIYQTHLNNQLGIGGFTVTQSEDPLSRRRLHLINQHAPEEIFPLGSNVRHPTWSFSNDRAVTWIAYEKADGDTWQTYGRQIGLKPMALDAVFQEAATTEYRWTNCGNYVWPDFSSSMMTTDGIHFSGIPPTDLASLELGVRDHLLIHLFDLSRPLERDLCLNTVTPPPPTPPAPIPPVNNSPPLEDPTPPCPRDEVLMDGRCFVPTVEAADCLINGGRIEHLDESELDLSIDDILRSRNQPVPVTLNGEPIMIDQDVLVIANGKTIGRCVQFEGGAVFSGGGCGRFSLMDPVMPGGLVLLSLLYGLLLIALRRKV